MPSFPAPQDLPTPQVLSCMSPWAGSHAARIALNLAVPSAQTNPAANQAIYIPFVVTKTATFTRGFWINGSAPSGNVSVGIYTPDGTRQATTGSVAMSGASVLQSAAFTANYTAAPGLYYMAIEFSAATATGITGFGASALWKQAGFYTQAVGSNPLPATATFATWTSFVVPIFGVAQTSFAL